LGIGLAAAVVAALLLGGLALLPRGSQTAVAQEQKPGKPGGAQAASVPVQVAPVQAGAIQQKTTLTGEFQPQDRLQVVARVTSRVTELPVDVGQAVKPGDVLVELDKTQLEAALGQAQASAAVARANFKKVESGARPEDVAAAQAAARQAQERLAQAQTQAGAVRATDLANAQAAVSAAEARLRQVTQGPTAADLANAEAALRGAQSRHQTVVNGAKPQDIDLAVQALNQAKESRAKAESQLANAKEQARIAVEQAAAALSGAQANYGAAKLIYDEAVRTGKDPNVPKESCPRNPSGSRTNCNELTDAKLRQYKAAFESAEQALRQAEQTVGARELAYEDAKKQEIAGLQSADSGIQSAQASLDKVKAGATPEEIATAQSAVDQAQAALDKLNQPARQADVDAAQASLNQARASLAKVQASPTDVGSAQAAVQQAQAQAEKAANPYVPADLEAAAAQVAQAEAAIKTAEVNLKDATIVAPFAGLVAAKNVSEGALAGQGTVLMEIVGNDVRGVFTIEEAQVGQVKLNQPATLTTTAYPGETFPGAVSVINPTANATTRSFGLKITPQDPQGKLKAGMFAQAELVTAEKQNALTVPETAVLTRDGKPVVFVIIDNKAQRREVTTGLRADGKIELATGVQPGEQVVVVGQNLLNDGDAVTVR
jgi:multidrug efflux pump subunit AcrA (membrane-fusion protein)